uniref:NADH-ubiquinone oxidoreductase chain 6 n=1 Tax=Gnathotrichus materiarius TaxID=1220286 RepID=A0A343A6N3_9CUCU|nr:NADH dehydrogenase subunit 6 [Gnathotrichus materiarius]AOY40238.1 NADH dehydrogenase subunit 6 [Gnathotrichus materiarius]
MLMMTTLSWLLTLLLIFLNHPLALGGGLLAQTALIALISGTLFYNFWFSYLLFLILIGGMLVMFMYMTSIASNEKFKLPNKTVLMYTASGISALALVFLLDKFMASPYIMKLQLTESENSMFLCTLNKFFSWPNWALSIMLMMYMLLTLIAVVKITAKKMGPLRQK